jgi:hypothetical protein
VHRLAHGSLPRNENDRFETPPEMRTPGRRLDERVASMKFFA